MHGQQASSRRVQFWFPDKNAWERADRKAISGPKLRKELSRKRKERKRRKKMDKVEMDAFRHFAKAKGVTYYRETLEKLFGALFWIDGANTVESLTTMFVERLDVGTHPELKVDSRNWPFLFSALREALKNNWMRQWTEQQQRPEFTAPTGADPLPDVDHPVYSEGDNLLHKLFLIPDLGSFIEEEEEQMFESFLKLAYGDEVTLLEARERFQHGTMGVSDVSTGPTFFAKHDTVLELKDRLVNKFVVVWGRDENSEGSATSGSEDETGG